MSAPIQKTEYQRGYNAGYSSGKSNGEFIGMLWLTAFALAIFLILDTFR